MHQKELDRANAAFKAGVKALADSNTPAEGFRDELRQLVAELENRESVAARLALVREHPKPVQEDGTLEPPSAPALRPRKRRTVKSTAPKREAAASITASLAHWGDEHPPGEYERARGLGLV